MADSTKFAAMVTIPKGDTSWKAEADAAWSEVKTLSDQAPVDPRDHGAVGDGTTDDRAAFQAAVDAAVSSGGHVRVPTPAESFWIDGSIQLAGRVALVHEGRYGPGGSTSVRVLVGNGVDPIIATGTYPGGDSATNRDIVLRGMTMRNNGAPCVDLLTANNFALLGCVLESHSLASTDTGTVRVRFSPRGVIRDCVISASGGAWAIDARDNCNGVLIDHNVLTGGSLGGAVNYGQSQSLHVRDNIIETSLVGIVASGAGTGSGQCFGCAIEGNYIENCEQPISVGDTFRWLGGSCSSNFISNGAATFTPLYGVQVGRLRGSRVDNNHVDQKATEPAVKVLYDGASVGSTEAPEGCTFVGVNHTGSTLYDLSSYSNVITRAAFAGKNRVAVTVDGTSPATGYREWVSPVVTADAGMAQTAIALDTSFGGWVDGVDVIGASGTIGCTVDVGTSVSATEITTVDPSTLTLAQGSAVHDVAAGWRVGSTMLARVVAGAGTGTFRFRVRWHGA